MWQYGHKYVSDDGHVSILQLIMCPGQLALAKLLVHMTFKPGVWGSKPDWALCALLHIH